MDKFPHWADHIVAFIFCVLLPLSAIRQNLKSKATVVYNSKQKSAIYFSTCFSLFVMAAVIVSVWLLFKRPLAEIGLTLKIEGRLWIWTVIAFVIVYAIDVINSARPKNVAASTNEWKKRTPFMPTKVKEFPAYVLLCLCAGVFEEIVFRGYIITYFGSLFRSSDYQQVLSVVLATFVFSISHFYHGVKNMIKVFILSICFGYLFVQSGSLLIGMVLHFVTNVIGGLLTLKYFKEEAGQESVSELQA